MEDIHDLGLGETKNLEAEEVEAKASGIVKNLIANLVTGDYGGGGATEEGKPNENSGGLTETGAENEENHKEAGGGIINHLISSLVSPRNTSTPNEQFAADGEGKSASGGDGGELNAVVKNEDRGTEEESEGGIINNLISNMFHHQGGRGGGGGGENESTGEKEDNKAETGRSGLVDELISNLPIHLGGKYFDPLAGSLYTYMGIPSSGSGL